MRAVLIAGGEMFDHAYIGGLIQADDLIVCADRGLIHAQKMGVAVDMLVGDMDSIGAPPEGIASITWPARKDLTDLELAADYARSRGAQKFLLLGATGGRIDHAMANALMLVDFLDRGEEAQLADEYGRMFAFRRCAQFDERPGTLISLLPLTRCEGVTTENLDYPLKGESMPVGRGRGISNVMSARCARVRIDSGTMLAVVVRRDL